ncbi:hypothetical protein [Brevibacterium moorei]|uniref:hypothetical protein n=1 Tax=Brevibacterium moorei TaxID=2968457 RepID=UPI00211C1EEA|nr:hypothetical protein [Brevibacterium sp. 68QC2CO]MCQ9386806.1 hypothetical protein [Brevibacterium sp. 68QC2CO]
MNHDDERYSAGDIYGSLHQEGGPRIIPSYDRNGNIAGLLNIDDVQAGLSTITKAAISGLFDTDRWDIADRLMEARRSLKNTGDDALFELAPIASVIDLVQHLQDVCRLVEAQGIPARAKLQEIYDVTRTGETN